MALHDVDKTSNRRTSPQPNAPDQSRVLHPSHYPMLAESDAFGGAVQTDQASQNIQDAIDALSERGGGTVTVPTGTYVFAQNLEIPSNVALVGQAYGSVLFIFVGPYGITATGTRPYSTGTVSVTRGSAAVTGSGTTWLTNLSTNHKIKIDGIPYQIAAVTSDTSLVLTTAQYGQTQSGLSYLAADFVEQIEISNVIIIASSSTAVSLTYVDQAQLKNVIVPGAGVNGMEFTDCARINADTIITDGCANRGINMTRVDFANFTRAISTNNVSHGIYTDTCSDIVFQSSPASANGGRGYYIVNGNRLAWNICNANENTSHGLYVFGASQCIVNGGSYSRNVDGINLEKPTSKVTISGGVIATGNSGYGVNIGSLVDRTIVTSNQLTGNSSGAINNAGTNTVSADNQT